MDNIERFRSVFSFSPTLDRVPVVEWAGWWDLTVDAWRAQGLPDSLTTADAIRDWFGLDRLHQTSAQIRERGCPSAKSHGAPIILDRADYNEIRPYLFTDACLERTIERFGEAAADESIAGSAHWMTLEGFFWFPRTLFGIENHLLAFYDEPELMDTINAELCAFYEKVIARLPAAYKPVFMTFAEDMSYNNGPMLSKACYDRFVLPYYRRLAPLLQAKGIKVFIDTDGNVEPLIDWFLEGGIEGVLPLERMAGVDVPRIRRHYPGLLMLGGFDKTVMRLGERAMRAEFERLAPVIASGGYIPAVDHQTPPDVSIGNYRIFVSLLNEYSRLAAR